MDAKLKVPFPPDPNPHKPRFVVPPGTCDTHFHIFGPPQIFPFVESRLYTPPAAPIEHYLSVAKAIGIERGVLVVPAVHGFENAVMHDALSKADGRLRGMIRANPDLTAADNRVPPCARCARHPFQLHQAARRRLRRGGHAAHHLPP